MRKNVSFLILSTLVFVIISCTRNTEPHIPGLDSLQEQAPAKQVLDITDGPQTPYQLDTLQMTKWTDGLVPFFSQELGRMYTAELHAIQRTQQDKSIIVVKTKGEDWNRLHLLTLNGEQTVIDAQEVSFSWGDLMEEEGDVEIAEKEHMFTHKVSDEVYHRTFLRKMETINYHTDSIFTEVDSLVEKISIQPSGAMLVELVDSVRHTKSSPIPQ